MTFVIHLSLSKILTQYSTTYHNTVRIHLTNISITKKQFASTQTKFFFCQNTFAAQQSKNILGNIQ